MMTRLAVGTWPGHINQNRDRQQTRGIRMSSRTLAAVVGVGLRDGRTGGSHRLALADKSFAETELGLLSEISGTGKVKEGTSMGFFGLQMGNEPGT